MVILCTVSCSNYSLTLEKVAATVQAKLAEKVEDASDAKEDPTKTKVLGKKLQTLVASRRAGKKSKLPTNYTGLGSTTALEDLQRFNRNELNLELQVCFIFGKFSFRVDLHASFFLLISKL